MTTIYYSNGTYEGDVLLGKRNGHGIIQYNRGRIVQYEGEWKDDMCHGMGKITFDDGRVISGLFAYNQYIGKVNIVDKNGNEKPLLNVDDYPTGTVSIIRPTKNNSFSSYKGEWYKGMRHGYGEFTRGPETPKKIGFFFRNQYIAKEILNKTTKKRIELIDGRYSGEVIITYPNDEQYIGHWDNGYRNGYGKYYYLNQDLYDGYWKYGERHTDQNKGEISTYYSFGTKTTYKGSFEDDIYNGHGRITEDNTNNFFEGSFIKGLKDGLGITFISNIGMSEGLWQSGRRIGEHTYSFNECNKKGTLLVNYNDGIMRNITFRKGTSSIQFDITSIGKDCSFDITVNSITKGKCNTKGDLILSAIKIIKTGVLGELNDSSFYVLSKIAHEYGSKEAASYYNNIHEKSGKYYRKVGIVDIPTPLTGNQSYEHYDTNYNWINYSNTHDYLISTRGCDTVSYLVWD